MWETGDWSDLTIIAGGRHFKVHKSVVCHGSPVIKAACSHDWEEARTGIINLPESASVIEELLATMYEISSPYMERDPGIMDAHENLSFRIAADKYHIERLLVSTEYDFTLAISDGGWSDNTMLLIDLGIQIYDFGCSAVAPQEILIALLWATTLNLKYVLLEQAAWNKLVACTLYHHDLMRFMSTCAGNLEDKEKMDNFQCGRSAKKIAPIVDEDSE
ncbi:Speckle-type POZ protein-like [Sphaerulina musiva]